MSTVIAWMVGGILLLAILVVLLSALLYDANSNIWHDCPDVKDPGQ